MRVVATVAVWAAAVLVTLGAAAGTEVGPVLAHLSASHGIHAGDVAVLVVTGGLAGAATAAIWRPQRP